jgi:uncharacterized damage-inducible protein DinB
MNLADSLRRQFAYNAWANREVLAAIQKNGGSERATQLMSHILAAERVWLERLKQQPQTVPVWPKPDVKQCEADAADLAQLWHDYLDLITAGDVSQEISYKNSKGESWSSAIADILTHVVTHSAYHRGQIASHMREKGQMPAYTDYVHAVRQGFVK